MKYSSDFDLAAIQKFHTDPAPRIGGIAILIGASVATLSKLNSYYLASLIGIILITSALPAFFAGLLEDITKNISPKIRLLSIALSAFIAGSLTNSWITSVDLLNFDLVLAFPLISIAFTIFCVTGVANSFNMIDGYHGLSSFVSIFILLALAYVAFKVQDYEILLTALIIAGAILGFFVWNYPKGLIFLGDGGAYMIGFFVAELSILLVVRNQSVSKWFPLLLCFYPFFETVFTLYRRLILQRKNPSKPDASHLHQLIYRRVVKRKWIGYFPKKSLNSLTAPYLWIFTCLTIIPALLFWNDHILLKSFSLLFALAYLTFYWSIVKFKVPKFFL